MNGKQMKNLLLLVFCLITLIGNTQSKTIDKIIAKVGGEVILYSDWQEQISFLKSRQGNKFEDNSCSILENLLIQKIYGQPGKSG